MGKNSQVNHNKAKKNLISDSTVKLSVKDKRKLNLLVGHLLKLTSSFKPSVTAAESWDEYLTIRKLLDDIMTIESVFKDKKKTANRKVYIDKFYEWLKLNSAEYDGLEISDFPGFDFGLKAKKQFKEGSILLKVPRKLMLIEENAKSTELSSLITKDPLLQNMPNITLALYLLLEKFNSDSFWKPYLDLLPDCYSTIFYFDEDDMKSLKPSPVYEQALKLFKCVARQYAYFYNKFINNEFPAPINMKQQFTYENYRWAVSTVMTRQNSIPASDGGSGETPAFIPLWDMCNHIEGKITTDFSEESNGGVCYALKDFNVGDQIFIFYGVRANCDLLLHNGFVYPNNSHDYYQLPLGVSSGDQLKEERTKLLTKLGLSNVTQYKIYPVEPYISPELLAFLRIFNMTKDELAKWCSNGNHGELLCSDLEVSRCVGVAVDKKAYQYLQTRCRLILAGYDRVSDADLTGRYVDLAKQLKGTEVKILQMCLDRTGELLEVLSKLEVQ